MHSEAVQLATYPLVFFIAGCFVYLLFRLSPTLSRETHKIPKMIFAMMISALVSTALLDLVVLAFTSFRFSSLHFVGPIAYGGFLRRQPALSLHFIVIILSFWFALRWLGNHPAESS
ncbi:MAG TPA: hypothetical protein VHW70_14985 [Edaphobacter sp.]|nr:hypothetical protein [Edaphobacter sp.]